MSKPSAWTAAPESTFNMAGGVPYPFTFSHEHVQHGHEVVMGPTGRGMSIFLKPIEKAAITDPE